MEEQNGQPETNGVTNGHIENGPPEATSLDEKATSPARSEGSQEGNIQLSAIKIITKRHDSGEEESAGDDEEEEEPEAEIKPKKMVKKKKKKKAKELAKPAEVLTSTLAKAIRMINEQKEKERKKIKQAEIRHMALEQKRRQEIAGPGRVLIHM